MRPSLARVNRKRENSYISREKSPLLLIRQRAGLSAIGDENAVQVRE